MSTLVLVLIFLATGLGIGLIFEDSRDFLIEILEEIFSFEWLGDVLDFFGGMFEDLGEFSIGGLIFGFATFGLIFVLRERMLEPFLQLMGPATRIFWMVVTYAGVFAMGYLVGKRIFDD